MDQTELLRFTIDVLERLSIRYTIVGSFASGVYGGSEKHLRDITGILRLSGELIDRDYISRFAEKLQVTEVWNAVLKRLGEREDDGGGG